jgi:hypothetical protein
VQLLLMHCNKLHNKPLPENKQLPSSVGLAHACLEHVLSRSNTVCPGLQHPKQLLSRLGRYERLQLHGSPAPLTNVLLPK